MMAGVYLDLVTWLAALVLIIAGILKWLRPRPAAQFLAAQRLPSSTALVRSLAGIELAVGACALILGGLWLLLVATLYALFAATLLVHRRRTGARAVSCGCLGTSVEMPIRSHVALALLMAAASFVGALADRRGLGPVLTHVALGSAVLLVALLGLTLCLLSGLARTASLHRRSTATLAGGSGPQVSSAPPPTFAVGTDLKSRQHEREGML